MGRASDNAFCVLGACGHVRALGIPKAALACADDSPGTPVSNHCSLDQE